MDLGVRAWGNDPDGPTVMLIGAYQMRGAVTRRLLSALPAMAVVRGDTWRSPLVGVLQEEIGKDEPGQDVVLDRLLDLLLIATLRAWFSRPDAGRPAGTAPTATPSSAPRCGCCTRTCRTRGRSPTSRRGSACPAPRSRSGSPGRSASRPCRT